MEPKRSVNRPAPEDVRTIGGAPKAPKDAGRELPRPTMAPKDDRTIGGAPKGAKTPEYMDRYAKTVGVGPKTPPKDAKTMGGVPKGVKTGATAAQTMGGASRDAKTMGSVGPGVKTMGSASPGVKTMGSVGMAKKGVPVASNKPMIGRYKTGGYVSKSSFKW